MMTRSQAAAFVFAQSVAAPAEIEAMKAENARREKGGYSQAYSEKDFLAVPDKYGI